MTGSWKTVTRRFLNHRGARWSAGFLAVVALVCVTAPLWTAVLGVDPYEVSASRRYAAPGGAHWLGTDDLGRDVLARLVYGGRLSLTVAALSALGSMVVGGALGLLAAYFGGRVDAALMRITDAVMSLPRLPLMILLLAVDLDKLGWTGLGGSSGSTVKLVLVVVMFSWTPAARLARASAMTTLRKDFVEAARAVGTRPGRIILAHVLPHALSPLVVAATIDVGQVILYESVLSYLGLGVQPPVASWGAMLRDGMTYLHTAPVLLVVPGLLTFACVAAVNFIGDGLRDALDPRAGVG